MLCPLSVRFFGNVNSTDKRALKSQSPVEAIAGHTYMLFLKFLVRGCRRLVTPDRYLEIPPRVINQSNSRIQDSSSLRCLSKKKTGGDRGNCRTLIFFDNIMAIFLPLWNNTVYLPAGG